MRTSRSQSVSGILILFLWVCLGLSAATGAATVVYVADDVMYEGIRDFDNFVAVTYNVLFIMLNIVYLVWLFLIHRDIREISPLHPISPRGAIIRMLPIIRLWGLASVFNSMADFIGRYNNNKLAKRLYMSIPALYVAYYGLNIVTRLSQKAAYMNNTGVLLSSVVLDISFCGVMLVMAYAATAGLRKAMEAKRGPEDELDPALDSEFAAFMKHFDDFESNSGRMSEAFVAECYAAHFPEGAEGIPAAQQIAAVRDFQAGKPRLLSYMVHESLQTDERHAEIRVRREFDNGYGDDVLYLWAKEEAGWKAEHIARRFEHMRVEKLEEAAPEEPSYKLYDNKNVFWLKAEPDHQGLSEADDLEKEVTVWAFLDAEYESDAGSRCYRLYKIG